MSEGDSREAELKVLLAETLRQMDYHWRRADAFERKATVVLTFSGALLAVLAVLAVQIVPVVHGVFRVVALVMAGVTAVLLIYAARKAFSALRARPYTGVAVENVEANWAKYRARIDLPDEKVHPWQVVALQDFVDQLVGPGEDKNKSPLRSMKADADDRGECFDQAIRIVFASLISIVVTAATVVLGRVL